jgi:hypothetical protein
MYVKIFKTGIIVFMGDVQMCLMTQTDNFQYRSQLRTDLTFLLIHASGKTMTYVWFTIGSTLRLLFHPIEMKVFLWSTHFILYEQNIWVTDLFSPTSVKGTVSSLVLANLLSVPKATSYLTILWSRGWALIFSWFIWIPVFPTNIQTQWDCWEKVGKFPF